MTEQNQEHATDNGEQNTNQDQNGNGTGNNAGNTHMVPITRLNAEIEKRKASDATLKEIADGFINDVPEDLRDIIPDLPPAQQIKWIQTASKKGLFNPPQGQSGPGSEQPGARQATSLDDMTPGEMIKAGLKTNKK
jgi:hypothetical protein